MTEETSEPHPRGRRLRSQFWFDNPDDPGMTALYFERYLNFGLTRGEIMSGRPIIGIAQSGSDCVTIVSKDDQGGYFQDFSSNTGTFANTAFTFVPPLGASEVRLVAFNHSNGGTCHSTGAGGGAYDAAHGRVTHRAAMIAPAIASAKK